MGWTVTGDKIVYGDFSDPDHRRIVAQPIEGGPGKTIGYANGLSAWSQLAVDPKSGHVIYVRALRNDTGIVWIQVARK